MVVLVTGQRMLVAGVAGCKGFVDGQTSDDAPARMDFFSSTLLSAMLIDGYNQYGICSRPNTFGQFRRRE